MQSVGYTQPFASDLHLLGDETEPEASISQQHLLLDIPTRILLLSGKTRDQDCDSETELPRLFSSWKKQRQYRQQIKSQAKRTCLDRLRQLVKKNPLC